MKAKKLIEVALPIKEISAESVRDKSIRHGHISTLHLWWARRPLPVCRAIVFASLVPDPLDEKCPQAFKDAVEYLLNPKDDKITQYQYTPYNDIPYTAVVDPMEDNLRNRLMMFIGKFSEKCQKDMLAGKNTPPKEQIEDGCLIKWENRNNAKVLRIARELIWVSYNAERNTNIGFETLHKNFSEAFEAIKNAENALYDVVDRHIISAEIENLEETLENAIDNFLSQMPSVFDPFAGGGAIPLEAARLGCRSFGNDINPVAHIVEKGSAELPQKFGKQICYSQAEFDKIYGEDGYVLLAEKGLSKDARGFYLIPNRLAFDVEYYIKKIIKNTEAEVGHLYPTDDNGNKPVAYYWARTIKCSNPSCGAEVPMLKGFYLCNLPKSKKYYYLKPTVSDNSISFDVQKGKYEAAGFLKSRECSLTCPCCGNITSGKDVKEKCFNHNVSERILAVIKETNSGKSYESPSQKDLEACSKQYKVDFKPEGLLPKNDSQNLKIPLWGYDSWASMFSNRQLYTMEAFVRNFKSISTSLGSTNYAKAVITYLAMWIDRLAVANTTFGRWSDARETIVALFSKQAIPMMFDYPESNPFCNSSGSAQNQLEWIVGYIESESYTEFSASFANASSGEKSQFGKKSIAAVVTDPPYYDAIAYADLSDFFYSWLKITLGDIYSLNFATPQTPKTEECTAIKHHFNGDEEKAKKHFEDKLTQVFDAIEQQTTDVVSIMFAHQSTKAWTTLCNSILSARMNITGSWPMDTERDVRPMAVAGAALESSVTVACRPSERKGYGDYKSVKKDIERKVSEEVESLYELGFRGADLLTACFGQAVSEFGKYKSVEKSDGSEVTVAELLEMARNAAFNALLKGVQGDDFTKFYIGWLQLNGTGETDFDDATKFTRVGVNVNIKDIQQEGLLILEGKKMHIAMADEHIGGSSVEGIRPEDSPISQAHRFILLNKEEDREKILRFVRDICPEASSPLWRLLATLKELLPANDDQKQVVSILQNAEDFRQHCHEDYKPKEGNLFDNMDI